jgi:hypothetical protein
MSETDFFDASPSERGLGQYGNFSLCRCVFLEDRCLDCLQNLKFIDILSTLATELSELREDSRNGEAVCQELYLLCAASVSYIKTLCIFVRNKIMDIDWLEEMLEFLSVATLYILRIQEL